MIWPRQALRWSLIPQKSYLALAIPLQLKFREHKLLQEIPLHMSV